MNDNTSSWMDFAQLPREQGGLGLQPHQAAGLVGNLVSESGDGLPSWGPTGDAGTAWGTAQWRGDRLDGLKQHASDLGLDYRSPEAQQSWMRREFDTTHGDAYKQLLAATTPEEAAAAVNRSYEVSADRSGKREQNARRLFDGSNPVSAINAAAPTRGVPGPGSLTSAFAQTDGDQTPPAALSVNNTMGPGVLTKPDKWDNIGSTMQGIAASLAGISSPEQAKAITAQQVAQNKTLTDQGTWSPHSLPDGTTFMLNSKTRQLIPMGKFAKPEQDPGDKKRAEEEAKAEVENYGKTQDAAGTAQDQLRLLSQLRTAVNDKNVVFGGGGDVTASIKNLGYTLGVPVEGLDNTQAVQRLATKMQLAQGKLLPGAISNYEDKLMGMSNGVGLDKSRESNIAAIDAQEKLLNHQIMLAKAAQEYRATNGKLDAGWDKKRQELGEAAAQADTATAPAVSPVAKPTTVFKTKSGIPWSVNP